MDTPDDWGLDPIHQQPISRAIQPRNGLFYDPDELQAIWMLVPDMAQYRKNSEHFFAFHGAAMKHAYDANRPFDHVGEIDDSYARTLLAKDYIAQREDPLPPYLHEECDLECKLPHIPMPWESGGDE